MSETQQTTEERITAALWAAIRPRPTTYGAIVDHLVGIGIASAAKQIAAEIDALTAERDAARADLAKCSADLQYEFDNPGDSRRRIAALEAEVARLRPAAEAWEAGAIFRAEWIRSREIHGIGEHWPTEAAVEELRLKAVAAAARAREAAKGQA